MAEIENNETICTVVVNHEEQYSIWPVDRDLPKGWQQVGVSGKKEECLDYIEEMWTDIRPLSIRKNIDQSSKEPPRSERSS